ncbi:MAG: HlyD family type I secretion periplasmic adaptor subunit [Magnetococcales bacterium]|nr:HlyD family type I secretion periplasmic adaptor subunit [Magnetococcales bacterium]
MFATLRRHWSIFALAWHHEKKRPTVTLLPHETAFLPAVLEITEAPPSPTGRWTAKLLMLLFVIAVVWAYFGKLETVATASGRIIHGGRVKLIQPLEAGVIKKILVKEGQTVHKGELLIELDPADVSADEARLIREWMDATSEAARFKFLGEGDKEPSGSFTAPDGVTAEIAERHRSQLQKQWGEHQAQLEELAGERRQMEARLRNVGAEIKKLERILPLIQERSRAKGTLSRDGNAPRMEFLELEQKRIETEESLTVKRHEREEVQATLETLTLKTKQLQATFRQNFWGQYLESDRKAASLSQELEKVRTRKQRGQLRAPEAGTVQQMKIFTEGGVVTPAQELMWIVPEKSALEVEAMVLNRDAGFVKAGQRAEIKLETFLFTKYGTLAGTVEHLSRDAVEDKTLGLVYPVRIALEKREMRIDGRLISLTPGLAVTAEINTGARTVLEYLLSPILKARQESLRER